MTGHPPIVVAVAYQVTCHGHDELTAHWIPIAQICGLAESRSSGGPEEASACLLKIIDTEQVM